MTVEQWMLVSPVLVAAATGVLAVVVDAFAPRVAAVVVAAVGLAAACAIAVWGALTAEPMLARELLLVGAGASGAWAVMLGLAVIALVGGARDLAHRPNGGGMAALVALSTAGSLIMFSSIDLVLTFIALETVAVCGYALVAGARTPRAREAAMKYFVQGAVTTGLFLVGLAVAFGAVGGGAGLALVGAGVAGAPLAATLMSILLVSTFAFKLGAVPFHSWAPDAFETAPAPAAAYLGTTPKLAAVGAVSLLSLVAMEPFASGETVSTLAPMAIFGLLALGSILYGNLAGLRQSHYGRMLGYSGIAQVGYVLVGLAVGWRLIGPTLMLVSVYALAAAGAFLASAYVRSVRPGWDGDIAGMAGLGRERPLFGIAMTVLMLSLTGVPLTAGFWGKLLVFLSAVGTGLPWIIVLVFLALLGSVVSFGYYGAVLRALFFDDIEVPTGETAEESSGEETPAGAGPGDRESAPPDLPALTTLIFVAAANLAVGIVPLFTGVEPVVRFFGLQ